MHADAALALVPGGRGVPVGIIDTGADVRQADIGPVIGVAGSVIPGGDPRRDRVGHGTFVAGIIAAVADGHGTRGVAGPTPLIVVKANRASTIGTLDAARAVVWAVDHGARVLNLSYSSGCPVSGTELRSLEYAVRRDVLVVASAGNEGEDGNPIECPAAWLGASRGAWSRGLSVGASTPSGARAPFSNANRFVSILAPGGNARDDCKGIASTLPVGASRLLPPDGCSTLGETVGGYPQRWAYAQGTSFATPVVAAVAALVRRVRPGLSAAQVADAVVRPDPTSAWTLPRGYGVVDALAAVRAALAYDTRPPAFRALRVRRPAPGRLRVEVAAVDRAGPGERAARGGLLYRVEARVDERWRVLYEGPRPARGRVVLDVPRSRTGPAGPGRLTVRVRVVDDRLNELRRVVRR